jgi:hypothetical protein
MRSVLALDPGSRTGWALFKTDAGMQKPRAGFVDMPDAGKDIGRWANAYKEWLLPFARLSDVTDIVSEAPIIAMHGGNPDINVVIKHVGILVVNAMCADELELPRPEMAYRSKVCKHFTAVGSGKSKELKARCMLHCQKKGWNVTDLNTADALATLDWFVHERGIEVPWDCQPAAGPLFTGGTTAADHAKDARATTLATKAMRMRGAA